MEVESQGQLKKKPMTVKEFAWRVAGPRDFCINLVVNATIPFWVFKGMDLIPLTGEAFCGICRSADEFSALQH